jgi:hypothetical protein
MDERLRAKLEELKRSGLDIDLKRNVALARLFQTMSFAESGEKTGEKLSLDEDEKYLYTPFRALSAVIIEERGFDFSKQGVLEKSTRLLQGQTVYPNHDHSVELWLGVVAKSWWDKQGTPQGINVTLKISKEWNQRIVAGIKEGAIHSVSVDVTFEYEKSHPDLQDFWYHFGETIDGRVVSIIATKILSYGEISLVWQGADGFAKRLDLTLKSGAGKQAGQTAAQNTGGIKSMKIFRSLLLKAGLTPSSYGMGSDTQEIELDDAGASALVNEIGAAIERLSKTNEEQAAVLSVLFGDGKKDKPAAEALKAAAAQGDAYINDLRTDAVKFAKLAEGTDKLSEALERVIMSAPVEDAKKLRDEYKLKAEEKAPLKCSKCGGTMSRGSAERGNEHGTDDEVDISAYELP